MQANRVLRSLFTVVLAAALAGVSSGCAVLAGGGGAGGDPDLLTREQLETVSFMTAYQAVQRLRPIWLRSERGQDSFETQGRRGLRVYVDGVLYGGKDALSTLQVQDIQEMRYLDKRQATMEFGTDHGEGALLILTRRGA